MAKRKTAMAKVNLNFVAESFIDLSFKDEVFDFVLTWVAFTMLRLNTDQNS